MVLADVVHPAAAVILAVAILIVAVAAFVLVWRKGFQSAHVDLGPVRVDLEATRRTVEVVARQTEAINAAVNNVPAGTPPLPERIAELEAMQRWTVMALRIIGAHTGASIPEPPRR